MQMSYFLLVGLSPYVLLYIISVLKNPWIAVIPVIFIQTFMTFPIMEWRQDMMIYIPMVLVALIAGLLKRNFGVVNKVKALNVSDPGALNKPVTFFITYLAFSIIIGLENGAKWDAALSEFIIFSSVVLYFPIVWGFTSEKPVRILLIAFLITAIIISVIIIIVHIQHMSCLRFGIFGVKSSSGEILGIHRSRWFIYALILLLSLGTYRKFITSKTFIFSGIGILGFRSVITLRRGPLLAIIIGFVAILILLVVLKDLKASKIFIKKNILLILIMAILGYTIAGNQGLYQGYGERLETEYVMGGLEHKFGTFSTTFDYIKERWLLGTGLGVKFTKLDVNRVHSLYLFLWLKCGIVGLALFSWILLKTVSLGFKTLENTKNTRWFRIVLGLQAGFISFIIYMMFSVLGIQPEAMIYTALVGGIFAVINGMELQQDQDKKDVRNI